MDFPGETAEARAWAYLKSIDPRYVAASLPDLPPRYFDDVVALAKTIANSTVGALRWAADREGAIVYAEAHRIEMGGGW